MRTEQLKWTSEAGWLPQLPGELRDAAGLALVFAGRHVLSDTSVLADVQDKYPGVRVFGCSTAGEICDTAVRDDSAVVTVVDFESSRIEYSLVHVNESANSFDLGKRLAQGLPSEGLIHVFVLSDGLNVNGSELVKGLAEYLPSDVSITGGLSGDGSSFEETSVVFDGQAAPGTVGALGLYGKDLRIGFASLGGWDPFGPERLITRSEGNVLYELDGRSALELYKTYLGEHAKGLPATGLLFPLSLRTEEGATPVVRTILGIDEAEQSMTFAGDVPTGAYARLMKANFDRLIDGAVGAAKACYEAVEASSPDLAILISCVGRKMVLKQRIEEEVEGVREVLGPDTTLTGFYSYGEISPFTPNAKCELHNQTMTITTISERAA
ncbi:MAG: FIST N-terminal domain-containing protein [Dehalococcoidia bacterium]